MDFFDGKMLPKWSLHNFVNALHSVVVYVYACSTVRCMLFNLFSNVDDAMCQYLAIADRDSNF